MLDHNHRMPSLHQVIQLAEQTIHVPWMQAGGWLIQHIQGGAPRIALQFSGELDALRFTAGQLCSRLTQAQIPQADIPQHLQ